MRARSPLLGVWLAVLTLLSAPGLAAAASFTDIDETRTIVEAGGPVSIETSLDPNRLFLSADVVPTVAGLPPDGPFPGIPGPTSDVNISVLFTLDEDAEVALTYSQLPNRNNGPFFTLNDPETGFQMGFQFFDVPGIVTCGTMPNDECNALAPITRGGGLLPAGTWELRFHVYAFVHTGGGSCSIGCNNAGGAGALEIIPEPGTLSLLGIGLSLLAAVRRGRRAS